MSELQSPEIFRIILDSLQTGIYVVDRDRKIVFWNDGAERITGYHRHDVVGRLSRETIFFHCNDEGCMLCGAVCPFAQTINDGKRREVRIQLRHKQGHRVPVMLRIVPIRDQHGSMSGAALSFDEQKFTQARDRHQHHLAAYGCLDEITGIPNHSFTQFHLRENLASFVEYHLPFSILCIQVDSLDDFRAKYGPHASDAILRVVAETMTGSLRPADFLGRWSADQFLAILEDCSLAGVEITGKRMRKIVTFAGLKWWGDELSVTVSIGHATAQSGDTIDLLIERASHSLEQHSAQKVAERKKTLSSISKD
ncbi:MAG TPA: diguanylate cyclase [Terriglobales bacterium]|nr:diguanylate cyclase [Terriglobales bacterium]